MEISSRKAERSRGKKLRFANTAACVVTTGKTLLQAFDRLEVAEATAHSIVNAHDIGSIQHITDEELDEIKVAFNLKDE